MLLNLPEFEYVSCETVEEACSLLSAHSGQALLLAGGTDVLVKMKQRRVVPKKLINIKTIPGLDYILYDEAQGLRIGALATVDSLTRSSLVMRRFGVLGQAANVLGTPHVRNLATLGGNICNASPAAECAPALLTLEAKVRISGLQGERVVPLEAFFTGPGKCVLREDEILTGIEIPNAPNGSVGVHMKHGSRRVDIAVVGVTILMTFEGSLCLDARIALSAVGPTPFRAKEAEDILKGEMVTEKDSALIQAAAREAAAESSPIDDIRGRANDRRALVETLVREGINGLIPRPKKIHSLDTFVLENRKN
jgi:CO/xanthine dehydrogenase FAD-binding subunit